MTTLVYCLTIRRCIVSLSAGALPHYPCRKLEPDAARADPSAKAPHRHHVKLNPSHGGPALTQGSQSTAPLPHTAGPAES